MQGRALGVPNGVVQLAHYKRADAERIAAGDHALRRHADQRVGAFDKAQRIDETVEQGGVAARRDEVDDHLGVRRRLKDRALADEVALEESGVGDVAVVGDREPARG